MPEDDESKSIIPVNESITKPIVEVNFPPDVPAIVGLGSVSLEQYSVAEKLNVALSSTPIVIVCVLVAGHKPSFKSIAFPL